MAKPKIITLYLEHYQVFGPDPVRELEDRYRIKRVKNATTPSTRDVLTREQVDLHCADPRYDVIIDEAQDR